MNDQKIKELIQSDQSTPKKQVHEWVGIVKEIETKNPFKIRYLVSSFAILALFVLGGYQGQKMYQAQQEQQIVEYLLDSRVFEEEDQLYAWID